MVNTFKPSYVNVAIETNGFLDLCPAQWSAMVTVEQVALSTLLPLLNLIFLMQAAYNAVKAVS
jgi:hypothetical protein